MPRYTGMWLKEVLDYNASFDGLYLKRASACDEMTHTIYRRSGMYVTDKCYF
jgi:hypothetical protein